MHVAHTDIYILHRLVNNKAACTVYITWLNRGFADFSNSTFREFSNPIYLAGFLGFGFRCVLVMCVLINHSLRFQAWNWIGLLLRKYLYVHAFYDLKRLTIQMLKYLILKKNTNEIQMLKAFCTSTSNFLMTYRHSWKPKSIIWILKKLALKKKPTCLKYNLNEFGFEIRIRPKIQIRNCLKLSRLYYRIRGQENNGAAQPDIR